MSSSGHYSSNNYGNQGSSSNSARSNRAPSTYQHTNSAGNPSTRYTTGPFSYNPPPSTSRCTSSRHLHVCGHRSPVATQRVAGCVACAAASPRQCTPTVIEVSVPTHCNSCQLSFRRDENGLLVTPSRQTRFRENVAGWLGRANLRDYRSPDRS